MKTLEKLSDFVGKYMAIIVLLIASLALFIPKSLSWISTSWVNYLLLKTTVNIDGLGMFLSIIKVVIIPIGLGFIINKLFSQATQKIVRILPLVSVTA